MDACDCRNSSAFGSRLWIVTLVLAIIAMARERKVVYEERNELMETDDVSETIRTIRPLSEASPAFSPR